MVGLLLNHIRDAGNEIFANFTFGEIDDKNGFAIVVAKFDAYFTKRDPQLMLLEDRWSHLRRDPGQSIDSWVNTVKGNNNNLGLKRRLSGRVQIPTRLWRTGCA